MIAAAGVKAMDAAEGSRYVMELAGTLVGAVERCRQNPLDVRAMVHKAQVAVQDEQSLNSHVIGAAAQQAGGVGPMMMGTDGPSPGSTTGGARDPYALNKVSG